MESLVGQIKQYKENAILLTEKLQMTFQEIDVLKKEQLICKSSSLTSLNKSNNLAKKEKDYLIINEKNRFLSSNALYSRNSKVLESMNDAYFNANDLALKKR